MSKFILFPSNNEIVRLMQQHMDRDDAPAWCDEGIDDYKHVYYNV